MMKAPGSFTDSTTSVRSTDNTLIYLPQHATVITIAIGSRRCHSPVCRSTGGSGGNMVDQVEQRFHRPGTSWENKFRARIGAFDRKRSCVYQSANDYSRGFMIQSTKRCSNHNTLASRIHSQPMGSMRKHITELSQTVRAVLYHAGSKS